TRPAAGSREDAPPLETVAGELRGGEDYANLLPGVLSARAYLKQANARIQTELERDAEPLSTFAWLAGHAYPRGELRYAWRTLIQNQPHDSICGCSIDAVHEENMSRFARAEQVAEALAERAATHLSDLVAPAPEGALRLVVFNTDAQARSGVVEATIDLPYASAEPHRRVDPEALDRPVRFWPRDAYIAKVSDGNGAAMPFQLLDEHDVIASVQLPRRFVAAHHGRDDVVLVEQLERHGGAIPVAHLRDVRVTGPEAHGTIERFGIDATVRLGARIWQIDRRFNDPAPGLCVGVEDDEPQGALWRRRHEVAQMRRRAFGKRLRDLFRARETAHVLLVDRVDAAAADAVVRLILNQRPPCISQLAARVRVSREPRER